MACHLSGVETAVATCGTAFGDRPHQDAAPHHARRDRRLRGEVIFTFDGDAAGQKAAHAGVRRGPAVGRPDLRRRRARRHGPVRAAAWPRADAAVRALVDDAVPMFEFAVRTTIAPLRPRHRRGPGAGDAGRGADRRLASATPALRPEYTRTVLAGWLGIEVEQVAAEVKKAGRVRHDDAVDTPHRPAGTDDVPEPAPRRGGPAAGARPARPRRLRRAAAAPGAAPVPRPVHRRGRRLAAARGVRGPGAPGRARRHPHRRPHRPQGLDRGLGRRGRRGRPAGRARPGLRAVGGPAADPVRHAPPACRRSATSTRSSSACATPSSAG